MGCIMAQDRRITKTRRAIKEALKALIMEKDSAKITITEVAQKADIDRKTFYLHYATINDIIRDFSKERLHELEVALREKDFFGNSFDIDLLFGTLNSFISDDLEFYRHLARNPGFSSFWEEARGVVKDSFMEALERELGSKRKGLDIYAEYFASGTIEAYLKWFRGESDVSQEELGAIVGHVSYYGFQELLPGG